MIGGEKPNTEIIRQFIRDQKNMPKIFLNLYGVTECTIISTYYQIDKETNALSSIPIGKPVSNTQCYVLDNYLQPLPVGVVGELYIGGGGVSAGYLNQPLKMQQSFISHSFSLNTQDCLYRTGDKVRWLPDGNLEYIGRSDEQIKLRGFRIELEEIETALASYPKVSLAVVCIRQVDEQRKQLEAYIIFQKKTWRSNSGALNLEKLVAYLQKNRLIR